jgi:SOS-response transcriptional repressors (RecA-mediated autopeptidases)
MVVDAPAPLSQLTRMPLPLVGAKVAAGFPSPAEDHVDRALDLNEHLIAHPAATFFVRVAGDSMRDAGIVEGDILIVDRSLTPQDRQIVVAQLDGEFCVKRLRRQGGRVWLESENPEYPRVELTEGQQLEIWGTVTFIIHKAR